MENLGVNLSNHGKFLSQIPKLTRYSSIVRRMTKLIVNVVLFVISSCQTRHIHKGPYRNYNNVSIAVSSNVKSIEGKYYYLVILKDFVVCQKPKFSQKKKYRFASFFAHFDRFSFREHYPGSFSNWNTDEVQKKRTLITSGSNWISGSVNNESASRSNSCSGCKFVGGFFFFAVKKLCCLTTLLTTCIDC